MYLTNRKLISQFSKKIKKVVKKIYVIIVRNNNHTLSSKDYKIYSTIRMLIIIVIICYLTQELKSVKLNAS